MAYDEMSIQPRKDLIEAIGQYIRPLMHKRVI